MKKSLGTTKIFFCLYSKIQATVDRNKKFFVKQKKKLLLIVPQYKLMVEIRLRLYKVRI
jgi:hypothetical protein